MAQSPDHLSRERIIEAVTTVLQRGRFIILGVVVAALVIVIGYGIFTEAMAKRAQAAARAAETVQKTFESWKTQTDASQKASLEKAVIAQTDAILKRYPRTYAAQRALFLRGDLAYDQKSWKEAESFYGRLADRFPKSYLAAVALNNAAASAEELGDLKGAIAFDTRILDVKGLAPEIPMALFSIGRLYDEQGDAKNAEIYYNKLINQYPDSGWTKLARDRIIALSLTKAAK